MAYESLTEEEKTQLSGLGYDVYTNPNEQDIASYRDILAASEKPPADVSLFSSDAAISDVAKSNETLKQFSIALAQPPKEEPPKVEPPKESTEMIATGTGSRGTDRGEWVTNPKTGTNEFFSEGSTISFGPKTEAAAMQDAEMERYKAELAEAKKQLSSFTMSSQELASQVQNISNQWDIRVRQMEDINRRRQASFETLGMRLGARWSGGIKAGMFGGIIAEEERQGLTRIAELESKKNAAIAEARLAANKQNWDVFVKQTDLAEKAVEQRQKEIEALNKKTLDANKLLLDLAKEQREKTEADLDNSEKLIKSIGYLALNSLTGDEQKDIETIKQISSQYKVDGNKLLSEIGRLEQEKVKYPAGDIGSYMFYRDQALETGVSQDKIMDYNTWLDKEANRKARAVAGVKPPTSAQETVASYASRIEQSNPILTNLEDDIVNMNLASFNVQISSWTPSAWQSDTIRQYMQASRNFINAVLRRESGAVISPTEFSEARAQYLPAPGDDETTLKQKEENRKIAHETFKRAAGAAYQPLSELLGESTGLDSFLDNKGF